MKHPPLNIVDSHQHFWDPNELELPPPSPECAVLDRAFLPADLAPELRTAGVNYSVLVQGYPQTDACNRWLFQQANQTPFVVGVVAWADLLDPDHLGRQLDDLADEPKFVGVRHIVEDEIDDRFLVRDNVLTSLRELARRSIRFDFLVRPRHLPVVNQVLNQVPELRAVIDHIGKPNIAQGVVTHWEELMAEIAQHAQVYCKLSGMVTEANWQTWRTSDLKPYVTRVINWFGPDRLMYGSDWPVCLLAAKYGRVWHSVQEMLAGIDENDYRKVFGGNAIEFYDLKIPSS